MELQPATTPNAWPPGLNQFTIAINKTRTKFEIGRKEEEKKDREAGYIYQCQFLLLFPSRLIIIKIDKTIVHW